MQVASENRPSSFTIDTISYSNPASRSLVRVTNKPNGYIQMDGSHSYGMKLSGTALHIDNLDYNDTSSTGSYMVNEGLILIQE